MLKAKLRTWALWINISSSKVVSHTFQDELQNGNASIKIRNAKMEDSGIYTCHFSGQNFCFELEVVDPNGRLSDSPTPEI
ncbi:uncharacterized protein V6R79_011150 [Siganus canaliculatus]